VETIHNWQHTKLLQISYFFLVSEDKLSFAARLEESDAREHRVTIDINYSAYWDHIIYEVRNKFYHSVLMQFTSMNKRNNQDEQ
jgi:hypothetical protein